MTRRELRIVPRPKTSRQQRRARERAAADRRAPEVTALLNPETQYDNGPSAA